MEWGWIGRQGNGKEREKIGEKTRKVNLMRSPQITSDLAFSFSVNFLFIYLEHPSYSLPSYNQHIP